jgi:uncharacterized DUF497 family protein
MNLPAHIWNPEKNDLLRKARGIGFEDVELAIDKGQVLANIASPNKAFPHQRMLVVRIKDYAHVVPFIEESGVRFLKTVYPSRAMQKKYGGQKDGS